MFKAIRPRTAIHAVSLAAAALTAGALAPTAAQAAPNRPMGQAIVEYGGPGASATVFVHGTHLRDNLKITSHDGKIIVKSLNGATVVPGYMCRWSEAYKGVTCPKPYRAIVRLYHGNDDALVAWGMNFETEVWGDQGNDVLKAEHSFRAPILLGGDDHDILVGALSREALWGGAGNDTIHPGGGADHIDGGHGAFRSDGTPFVRSYVRNDGECGARTHGFWDRFYPSTDGPEGVDTLDLRYLQQGVLADINICRLGWFSDAQPALVHAMENVVGTRFNDRLVGDGDANVLTGDGGQDWITGEGGPDRILAVDGSADTVKCSPGGDVYYTDAVDQRIGC